MSGSTTVHFIKRQAALHAEVKRLRAELAALKRAKRLWVVELKDDTQGCDWDPVLFRSTQAEARQESRANQDYRDRCCIRYGCERTMRFRVRKYVRVEP